jgi:hypothetical protein
VRREAAYGIAADKLLTVMDQTMQPTAVSLWLRPSLRQVRTGTYIAHAAWWLILSWLLPGLHAGRTPERVSSCTRSSRGVAARPVSNLVSIGVPVPSGRGRLRRSGPPRPGTDRPAGHGKADAGVSETADYLSVWSFQEWDHELFT